MRSSDVRRLEALTSSLRHLDLDGPPVWDRFLPELRELLSLDVGMIYGVRQEESGYVLDQGRIDGAPHGDASTLAQFDQLLRSTERRWGIFDPARPEPKQRNVVHAFEPAPLFQQTLEDRELIARKYGVQAENNARLAAEGFRKSAAFFEQAGMAKLWQLRILVCDEDTLLG